MTGVSDNFENDYHWRHFSPGSLLIDVAMKQVAAMLRISELSLSHGKKTILKTLSLTLGDGETIAIMGPSGCGKTTLLKSIAGFVEVFSSGQISYKDVVWQDQIRRHVCAAKREATLLFQEHAIWPHLSVKQQLDLIGPTNDSLIERLGLNPHTLGRDLSGGEKQRLALGRVLKTGSRLLLLDEPFASLDRDTKASMIVLLREHQSSCNCAFLITTHDQQDAQKLGARLLNIV
jgi:ABC-type Fe3+/spermidine/putrescine transport system ATPase subunit